MRTALRHVLAPTAFAVLAGVSLAFLPPFKHAGRVLLLVVAGFGLVTIVFGLSRSFPLSLLMLGLLGALDISGDHRGYHRHTLALVRSAARMIEHRLFETRHGSSLRLRLHAHFAHDPTLIALLAQQLTGISFSFTAHARDLVQIPAHLLNERTARATAMLTCSATNLEYIDQVMPAELQAKVRLIHHGVNLAGFQPLPGRLSEETGAAQMAEVGAGQEISAASNSVPRILSVGRLVEKKGFPDLINACALLRDAGLAFRCAIYGEGPLEGELRALIDTLGLADAVTLPGACSQQELIPELQRADLFALASFVTDDGDRDGVPNVLVEAMACGLPVVSTTVAGIPELVKTGENGVLVPPRDVAELADALAKLLRDPAERARMARAARRTVVEHFDLHAAAQQIARLFEKAVASPPKMAHANV
jgi:glycosyltransferase involved in cell wall biosynthesis